ncbi:MAG: hypothetical protein ABI628_03580, partial [Chloroflexota bacterium]
LAFERCRVEEPPLFDVGGGQQAACWLAEGGRELPMFPVRTVVSPAAPPGPTAPSEPTAPPQGIDVTGAAAGP